jgi:hypothetical protein
MTPAPWHQKFDTSAVGCSAPLDAEKDYPLATLEKAFFERIHSK